MQSYTKHSEAIILPIVSKEEQEESDFLDEQMKPIDAEIEKEKKKISQMEEINQMLDRDLAQMSLEDAYR